MPKGKTGEINMFDTVKEIIKATGVVVGGGAGFILIVKIVQALLELL